VPHCRASGPLLLRVPDRNTIPFLASVVPTLKLTVRKYRGGVGLFLPFIMPPERSKKYKERLELALLIEAYGLTMPSCSYCEANARKCVVAKESSSRCNECVRRGRKCDVQGPSAGDISTVLREQARVREERKATLAKLLRLDQQEQFL
jgi:hypothetical protein